MANGILVQDLENSGTPASNPMPDLSTSVANTNPTALAGPMQQATTYTPPNEALVSSQLERILAKDSPYLDQARTRASQMASRRGLLNSSIAASSGESAAIGAALPIAQQDASTWDTAGRFNAGAANDFSRDANAFTRQGALTQYGGQLQTALQGSAQRFTAGENAAQRQFQSGERIGNEQFTSTRDAAQFQNRLAEIGAQTASAIQIYDAQNGTRVFEEYQGASQATYDSYLRDVQAIQVADMDPDVKAAQIANLQGMYATRQTFINTIYAESPRWRSEWSQFDMTFAGEPA